MVVRFFSQPYLLYVIDVINDAASLERFKIFESRPICETTIIAVTSIMYRAINTYEVK